MRPSGPVEPATIPEVEVGETDAVGTDVGGYDAASRTASALLEIIAALSGEVHSQRPVSAPTLDSVLDRDLGFDSLARTELILRVEQRFDVSLPDHALAADTVRDLLRAVLSASGRAAVSAATVKVQAAADTATSTRWPAQADTLLDVLDWHVNVHPERVHAHIYDEDRVEPLTYGELYAGASAIAAGLLEQGVEPGQTVAIMLPTGREYLFCFLGALIAGAIPVPIYPPLRPSQIEEHLRRHARILDSAQVVMLVTVPEAAGFARLLKPHVRTLRRIVAAESLVAENAPVPRVAARPDDVALLQYTSGSTGQPKGVIVTHAQVLANLRAAIGRLEATPSDVFVSWLPLYHDMGLIGAWLGSLYVGCELVLMSPLRFLARPSRWLWATHAHGGTLSASPNFGYELCLRKIPDSELEGLDLSSWRVAMNGAEPVSPQTLEAFVQRFADYGFRPDAAAPVYGLAESTLALAMPNVGRGLVVDRVNRDVFRRTGQAVPADEDDPKPLVFAACGHALPGQELRVVNALGVDVQERQEGRLQFRGSSATTGYYRNPEATAALFAGPWLDSGDRAYLADGHLFITGRDKEIIIRGGRNIYPYELEQAVGDLDSIRKGCVAAFGAGDPASGTERLVVVAETAVRDHDELRTLQRCVEQETVNLLSMPPDEVLLVKPHTVLKTSSGKIRRTAVRDQYEEGTLGKRGGGFRWQLVRLVGSALVPALRRMAGGVLRVLYGCYALTVALLIAVPAAVALTVLPRLRWRWRAVRLAAVALFRLTGMRLIVTGRENLPLPRPFVLIANHASYLDGLVMMAAAPLAFTFVAKAELARVPGLAWLLARLGIVFVERFDRQQSTEDAQRMSELASRGHTMCFFPEGTFRRQAGLLPFHSGAFRAAADARLPVVPVVLRGTRRALPDGAWLPRAGSIRITFLSPIAARGDDWRAAIDLGREARAAVLKHSGEPDLAADV